MVNEQWLASLDDMESKSEGRNRIIIKTLPPLDRIRKTQEFVFTIIGCDINALYVKGLLNFIAHKVINGLHIQFGCQTRLHAVDDGEFGVTLFGLFEQTLRLVEETGVFERNTHGVGEGLQEPHIRFTERIL